MLQLLLQAAFPLQAERECCGCCGGPDFHYRLKGNAAVAAAGRISTAGWKGMLQLLLWAGFPLQAEREYCGCCCGPCGQHFHCRLKGNSAVAAAGRISTAGRKGMLQLLLRAGFPLQAERECCGCCCGPHFHCRLKGNAAFAAAGRISTAGWKGMLWLLLWAEFLGWKGMLRLLLQAEFLGWNGMLLLLLRRNS